MIRKTTALTRRGLLAGVGCAVAAAAAGPALAAPNILRGAGDIRSLKLVSPHTGDRVKAVYWVEGEYIPEALREIDHVMRDWRADAATRMDPKVIDIMAAVHRMLDTDEPFSVYSGYRTRATNNMLRRRSRGVATNSYHCRAMAADLHLKSRSVRQIAGAGERLGVGGVGRYSRSDFTHLDCGPRRGWGA